MRRLPSSVRLYQRRREAGLCPRDGRPAEPNRATCIECLERGRARMRPVNARTARDRAVGEYIRRDTPWLYAEILAAGGAQ